MTINEVLREAIDILKKANIEEPVRTSKILLAFVLGKNKEYLLINDNKQIEENCYKKFIIEIKDIANGKPLQYITHNQEFMGLNFFVNESVLIPRADTETLVEEVISIIKTNNYKNIMDMCTGSGAIAVSIAKYTDIDKICAVDISKDALEVAKKNAQNNNVISKIEFINSDMFKGIDKNVKFDMIVSNPPYIETSVIPSLDKQVKREPNIALDGGIDGLDFYRDILENAKKYLNKNGVICMEIGYNQKENVMNLFKKEYKKVYCKQDLAGNDRVVIVNNE